jgi:hypothetical protein
MKPPDLYSGGGAIRQALEDLLRVGEESREEWNDAVSKAFFEDRIEPIVPIVKNALDAVGRMQLLIAEAHRDMQG